MAMGRLFWHAWLPVIAAAVVAATAGSAPAQAPAAARPQTPAQSIQRDLEQQAAIVSDPNTTQAQRDEAAKRLAQRATPESQRLVNTILIDASNPRGQLAIARALAGDVQADPLFVNPLFALLGTDQRTTEAAAQALTNYRDRPEVFVRLVNFANSRQQRPALRIATIRALGTLTEKRAAQALMSLLQRPDEDNEIRNAAADALVEMTGLRENDRDGQRWAQWWQANQGLSDGQFQAEQLALRAARFSQLQMRYSRLAAELDGILTDRYRASPPSQQPDLLLRYLNSSEPEVRSIGARLVAEDAVAGTRPPPAEAKQRLREMIGDSSTDVRIKVVWALRAVNDPEALDRLLTQLPQESSADVRAAIAQALAQIGDLRAVPELLKLLDDTSLRVAESAAGALRDLGAALLAKDPQQARQVALRLQAVVERRRGSLESGSLREAAVLALAPLRERQVAPMLYRLLRQRDEPVGVRRAAIRALGMLGDKQASDPIAGYLSPDDSEPRVRWEAVHALGELGAAEHADAVAERTSPAAEADPSVRDEAWRVLSEKFLPALSRDKLAMLADRFRDDPTKRLAVLQALAEKQQAENDLAQLAYTRQNVGETLLQLARPQEADPYFRQALEYWQGQKVENVVTERLIEQRVDSLLRGKQYAQCVRFGEELIARQTGYQQTIGSHIRAEVERLAKDGNAEDALALIAQAKTMNPPLAAQYAEVLDDIEKQIQRSRNAATTNPKAEMPPHDRVLQCLPLIV